MEAVFWWVGVGGSQLIPLQIYTISDCAPCYLVYLDQELPHSRDKIESLPQAVALVQSFSKHFDMHLTGAPLAP